VISRDVGDIFWIYSTPKTSGCWLVTTRDDLKNIRRIRNPELNLGWGVDPRYTDVLEYTYDEAETSKWEV